MKKIVILALSMVFNISAFSQNINFCESLDEAINNAKSQNKLIFLDFYSSW